MAIHCQQLPGAGHATQLDAAAILEAGARADDQVPDRAVDKDFAHPGLTEDARRNVYRDPPDVGAQQFTLAGVDTRADLDTQCFGVGAQGFGPSNVVRWPSPVLLTMVPPKRSVTSAVISPKRCSTARHRSSPTAAACAVEATMSVNNTVRRASQTPGGENQTAATTASILIAQSRLSRSGRARTGPVGNHWAL
jgi:hypothetical protein